MNRDELEKCVGNMTHSAAIEHNEAKDVLTHDAKQRERIAELDGKVRILIRRENAANKRIAELERIATSLWDIIDDIDTASDMAKGDDGWYRKRVEHKQRERFKYGETDGYDLTLKIKETNK
ncbi:MAG: hypothetical protein GY833_16560 [Aestuariibacter sp.]|nr:hypothetical protein [Aestuariibacter sp.]